MMTIFLIHNHMPSLLTNRTDTIECDPVPALYPRCPLQCYCLITEQPLCPVARSANTVVSYNNVVHRVKPHLRTNPHCIVLCHDIRDAGLEEKENCALNCCLFFFLSHLNVLFVCFSDKVCGFWLTSQHHNITTSQFCVECQCYTTATTPTPTHTTPTPTPTTAVMECKGHRDITLILDQTEGQGSCTTEKIFTSRRFVPKHKAHCIRGGKCSKRRCLPYGLANTDIIVLQGLATNAHPCFSCCWPIPVHLESVGITGLGG